MLLFVVEFLPRMTMDRTLQNGEHPRRLLFVVNVAWFFLSHRLPIARAAAREGFRVHLATTITDERERRAIADAGIELHEIPFGRSSMHIFGEVATLRPLARLYSRLQPELIHHVSIKPVIYGSLLARCYRIRAVVNSIPGLGHAFLTRGWRAELLRRFLVSLYRLALRPSNVLVIFQNQENREYFLEQRIVRPAQCALVRGVGVDLAAFNPTLPPAGAIVVTMAARMLKEKGVEIFVTAARRLRSEGHAATFRLVGDPDPMSPGTISRELLDQWNSEGVVNWLGHRADMPNVMAESHIVCLPTYYGEGLPKVLLEAAAAGRPIVTTAIPGCRDIGRHGENALLVTPRDVDSLVDALRTLITDRGMREQFGRRGREIVEQEFSETSLVQQTLDVYREALGQAPRSS
jgi:glycosyltransferase involved in cell wall biosynthesis